MRAPEAPIGWPIATAAPPSLIDEALAAVTEPSFLNTGLRFGILSGLAFFGPSSSLTTVDSPFLPAMVTGTISALNRPCCWAAIARLGGSRDALAGGAFLGAHSHVLLAVNVPEAVVDHHVLELDVPHARALAHRVG